MPLYEFVCEKCDTVSDKIFKAEERPKYVTCENEECGGNAEYVFGKVAYFRVKYEQNGRVGYKYDLGDGKKRHASATRENYEHNIGSKPLKDVQNSGSEKSQSVLTKEYGRHVKEKEKEKVEKQKYDLKEAKKC